MKKTAKILSVILCAVLAACLLTACSDAGKPSYDTSAPQYTISAAVLEQKLDAFLDGREDRTSYTDAEFNAATYLAAELASYGYEPNVSLFNQLFTVNETNASNLKSQNIYAVYSSDAVTEQKPKNVIIGAYYDNRYTSPFTDTEKGTGSSGALSNGTGVATLLAIAEYLTENRPQFEFTVTLAFFGASSVSNVGVSQFYNKMTPDQRDSTVLMIELQRLGVDHVYAYSDSRKTSREPYFDGVAKDKGLDVYKVTQKSPLMNSWVALRGIPYYQWAMSGNFTVFFNYNIPTLNIVGANWETIDMTDTESADHPNMELTSRDTLSNLKDMHPDYGQKMATAATLVIEGLKGEKFLETMKFDRANFPDTDILLSSWIWNLIVLGVILIAAGIMTAVNAHLAKKYPIVAPQPKKMKMAVFGMDYEDADSADIFIDIKKPDQTDDIFPGIPNNDTRDNGGSSSLYPPFVPHSDDRAVSAGTRQDDGKANEKQRSDDIEQAEKPAEESKVSDEHKEPDTSENAEADAQKDNAEDGESDGKSSAAADDKPTQKASAPRKTTAPRKSVSAGKAVGAKKSTGAGTKKPSAGGAKKPSAAGKTDGADESKPKE